MTYDEMMERFGSDKPDLRYGMELVDLAPVFAATGFNAFAKVLADGGVIKALAAPGAGSFSRKELDRLVEDAKGRGAAGLVWIVVEGDGNVRSPVEKFLSPDEIAGLIERTRAAEGDLVCIVADRERSSQRRARRPPPRPRDAARADPRGRLGVLLDGRPAAVRVERRGGTLGVGAPPLHLAGLRRPHARDGARPAPTTSC